MEIIEYQTYREEEILPLYASVGWTAYTDAPDVLHRGFERSLLTFAAYEGKRLSALSVPLATARPSCSCRTCWSSRSTSAAASAQH